MVQLYCARGWAAGTVQATVGTSYYLVSLDAVPSDPPLLARYAQLQACSAEQEASAVQVCNWNCRQCYGAPTSAQFAQD